MSATDPNLRAKQLLAAFRMPAVQTMVSRKSSITNAFVNALIPVVAPRPDEIAKALQIFQMDVLDVRCAYCGDPSTEWDHLRPLVVKQRPTGYVSEIANLVPACGKCNQSKGNKAWREWIVSTTGRHSPTVRKIEIASRIERLEEFERQFIPTKVEFEKVIGPELWQRYWVMWEQVNAELKDCQQVAEELRAKIAASIENGPV